jgi:hypothetical protein
MGGRGAGASAAERAWRAPGVQRVRLVRGGVRGVSGWYGTGRTDEVVLAQAVPIHKGEAQRPVAFPRRGARQGRAGGAGGVSGRLRSAGTWGTPSSERHPGV